MQCLHNVTITEQEGLYLLRFRQVQLLDEVTQGVGLPDEQHVTAQAVPPLWNTRGRAQRKQEELVSQRKR